MKEENAKENGNRKKMETEHKFKRKIRNKIKENRKYIGLGRRNIKI